MSNLFRRGGLVCICLVWMFASTACSVLTSEQVNAVKQFSKATDNYGQLPGDVIRMYRDVVFTRQSLLVGRSESKDDATDALATALDQLDTISSQADRTDKALRVLDDYSKILTLLTSDNYTTELNAAVSVLGVQLDGGIALYNSKFLPKTPLDSIGGTIAAVVRGGGGIWIRHQQSIALRDAVTKGEPVVNEMTAAVEDLAGLWLVKINGTTLIAQERDQLQDAFLNSIKLAAERKQTIGLGTTERVVAALDQARDAESLAKLARDSALKYREAHKKLVEALNHPTKMGDVLADIKALKEEVDAARKIQKDLSK